LSDEDEAMIRQPGAKFAWTDCAAPSLSAQRPALIMKSWMSVRRQGLPERSVGLEQQ
jgi:hypothetical protein